MKNIFNVFRGAANGLGDSAKALVACFAIVFAGAAQAAVETKNGVEWTYEDIGSGNAKITAIGAIAPEKEGYVAVPDTLGAYTVTTIGNDVFAGRTDVAEVKLPASSELKSIGARAFSGCVNLTSVDLYVYVENIGEDAFKGCASLKRVEFPVNLTSIGANAFENCTSLESATLLSDLTSLPSGLFKNCAALKNVDLLDLYYLVSIGEEAFRGCTALESIEIPDGVATFGARAFHSCAALKEVTIWSKMVMSIGIGAFFGTTELKTIYVAEGMTATVKSLLSASGLDVDEKGIKVKEISDVKYWTDTTISPNITWAYRTIGEETEVNKEAEIYNSGAAAIDPYDFTGPLVVPSEIEGNTVTRIGESAFSYCPYLTSVTIPDGVTSIGNNAFDGCAELESVDIPDSVTSIGGFAFEYCYKLKSVKIPDGVASIGPQAFFECAALESVEIPDSVTSIENGAFYGCTALEGVEIPAGVTSIGANAFYSCTALASVEISAGVTSIGANAFYSCTALASVEIPGSVTSIGDEAFYGCSALVSVEIQGGATIGGGAFENCTALESVEFPGVTDIGDWAFSYCTALESVEIPGSVTSIGADAFYGCSALVSVEIQGGATIGVGAFENCTALESVEFPGVTDIGDWAFYGCTSLKSVEIPSGVTSIGDSTFNGCAALESVAIPYGVVSIGADAFNGCAALVDAALPDSVTSIGSQAFYGCGDLKNVVIPDSVASIASRAFEGCSSLEIVTIGSGTTVIPDYAFKDCIALESVEIPDGVTSIGKDAFKSCSALTSAAIPSSVTTIGTGAFAGTALSTVFVEDMVGESSANIALTSSGLDTSGITFVRADVTPPHKVSFNGTAGNCTVSSKTVYDGYAVGVLPSATREGYVLKGWFTAAEGGMQITEATVVTGDVMFYAQWIAEGCVQETVGGVEWTYKIVGEHAEICNGDDSAIPSTTAGAITVPQKLGGKDVTVIGDCAFINCSSLTYVTIPAGVTRIGNNAFFYCSSLTGVTMPEGLTSIGANVFFNCSNLENTEIPSSVTDIGIGAFYNCHLLTKMTVPEGVTVIADYTFNGCTALEKVTFLGNVTSIGECAFNSCLALTEVTIPASVVTVNDDAFYNCTSLAKVTLLEGLTEIGERVFFGCTVLTEVTIPASVTSVGEQAFKDCSTLSTMVILSKMAIQTDAFDGCTALTTVYVMADDKDYLEGQFTASGYDISGVDFKEMFTVAFDANGGTCGEVSRIVLGGEAVGTLPDAMPSSSDFEFKGWYTATVGGVKVTASTIATDDVTYYAQWLKKGYHAEMDASGVEWIYRIVDDHAEIYYDGYAAIPTVTSGAITVPATLGGKPVTVIGEGAFDGCDVITGVTIQNGVTAIGEGLFSSCTGLKSVTIPGSVTEIGDDAFFSCSALESVTMEEGVASIGNRAFSCCYALTEVTIPASVTEIGESAFYSCDALATVTLKEGLTSIGVKAFAGCTALTSMTIPDGVTTIGYSAFEGCSALENVTISGSVTAIGDSAFSGCDALTDVTVQDGVASIGAYAFCGCTALEHADIPASVTSIGDYAFSNCPKLANEDGFVIVGGVLFGYVGTAVDLTVPNGVTRIGSEAFYGCTSLKDVTVPESVTHIEDQAFYGCTSLECLRISACVNIGPDAFASTALKAVYLMAADKEFMEGQFTASGYDISGVDFKVICTVTFNANGGTCDAAPRMVLGGETVGELPVATFDEVHTLKGWFTETVGGEQITKDSVVSGNMTCCAQWLMNSYTLSFDSNGGTAVASITQEYGTEVVAPASPTRTGFTFTGWQPGLPATVPAEDTVYVAQWEVVRHSITLDLGGGTGTGGALSVDYGTCVGDLPAPTRENYDFTGWSATADGDLLPSDTVVTDGLTLYARWQGKQVKMEFDSNGGTAVASITQEYGTEVVAPASPTRTGFTFTGWQPGLPATVPAEDTVYVAQWEENGGSSGGGEGGGSSGGGEGGGSSGGGEGGGSSGGGEGGGSSGGGEGGGSSGGGEGGGSSGGGEGGGSSGGGEGGGSSGGGEGGSDPIPDPDPTPTPDPEPEVIYGIHETISGAAPTKAASEYNGYLADANGVVKGTIQVKVGMPGKKDGKASVKASVVLGTKKVSLKAKEKGKAVILADGPTAVELSGGDACEVLLGADGISGFYGAYTIDGSRNFFTSKDKVEQTAANGILNKWLGTVLVFWDGGSLSVSIASKGKAKVNGTLVDGKTKVSANAVFLVGDGWCCVPVSAPKANLAFAIWLSYDGVTAAVKGLGKDALLGRPGTLAANAKFHVSKSAALWASIPGTVLTDYLPDGIAVTQKGTKWTLPKAGKVVYKKGVVDESKLGMNPSGLKLTYTAKDGSFKGSFKVYADNKGKLKSTTVNVTGYVVDGVGYGTATVKKVGSVDVFVGEE